ncbi:hypothetical protein L1987_76435 [Smallanthus sonchifolius]|uniref:Uncharacterized protein n=1 Tax=Smallanthus sonchifolius TaxID=185202 RepID=A0ACB8Z7F9_9ASTR|nr:hypothetical protein L1987_76435 [Smallanthus sonchifolius]
MEDCNMDLGRDRKTWGSLAGSLGDIGMPCTMRIRFFNHSNIVRECLKLGMAGYGLDHKYVLGGTRSKGGTLCTRNTLLWSGVRFCRTYGTHYGRGAWDGLIVSLLYAGYLLAGGLLDWVGFGGVGTRGAHDSIKIELCYLIKKGVVFAKSWVRISEYVQAEAVEEWSQGEWDFFANKCMEMGLDPENSILYPVKDTEIEDVEDIDGFDSVHAMSQLKNLGSDDETHEGDGGNNKSSDQKSVSRLRKGKLKPSSLLDGTKEAAMRRYGLRNSDGIHKPAQQNIPKRKLSSSKSKDSVKNQNHKSTGKENVATGFNCDYSMTIDVEPCMGAGSYMHSHTFIEEDCTLPENLVEHQEPTFIR